MHQNKIKMKQPIKNIIFDWHGVFSDDFEPVYLATMDMYKELNIPKISREQFRKIFEFPYISVYTRFKPGLDREDIYARFTEIFLQKEKPSKIDGSDEILEHLTKNNIKLFIISASPIVEEEMSLFFPAKEYFSAILPNEEEKAGIIKDFTKKHSINPEQTLFVGDFPSDIITGKAAGMKTCAITSSWGQENKLKAANPDFFITHLLQLKDIIQ